MACHRALALIVLIGLAACARGAVQDGDGEDDSNTPCATSTATGAAARKAAAAQLASLRRLADAGARYATTVRSWEQLVQAVEQYDGPPPANGGWAVFELAPDGDVEASSTLQLRPGIAVVGRPAAGQQQLQVSCGQGVETAFAAQLGAGAQPGVLLQGLALSGCSGSAVTASGTLARAALPGASPLPAGLALLDCTLRGNTAQHGAGIRARGAAVFLDAVTLEGNAAAISGGGVSLQLGLLVGSRVRLTNNTAHKQAAAPGDGAAPPRDAGTGAAVHANASALLLLNSSVAANTGAGLGGCAINAAASAGLVLAGCAFEANACTASLMTRAGVPSSDLSHCDAGGASLMVDAGMPPPAFDTPVRCGLAPKHLALITDTSFARDLPARLACGGSVKAGAAWLELERASFSDVRGCERGAAVATESAMLVLRQCRFARLEARGNGGAVQTLAGQVWVLGSTMRDCATSGSGGGCMSISDGRRVHISRSTFDNCSASETGGGIFNQVLFATPEKPPPFTMHASRVSRCRALREAGAVSLFKVNITMTDCEFDSNEGYYGAVVQANGSPTLVTGCNFTNNVAAAGGQGGTWNTNDLPDVRFDSCSWVNNSAYQGAAIFGSTWGGEATWTFARCSFIGNTAEQRGGAVWITGANVTFEDSTFEANAALMGAGVYATNTGTSLPLSATWLGGAMRGNAAQQSGGAAWLAGLTRASLRGTRVAGNTALRSAGGVYLLDTAANLTGAAFEANAAQLGAALMLSGNASVVRAASSRFEGNEADDSGGVALLMSGSRLLLSRSSLSNNTAGSAGGAVVVLDGSQLACSAACVWANNSAAIGGAIAADSSAVQLAGSELRGNRALADLVTVAFGAAQHRAGCGGAVFCANASLALAASEVAGNAAELRGGGLLLLSSALDARDTKFTANAAGLPGGDSADGAAGTAGGALMLGRLEEARGAALKVALSRCTLAGNRAAFGGALAAADPSTELVTSSGALAAAGDTPALAAAAPAAAGSLLSLNASRLDGNAAAMMGGALFAALPGLELRLSGSVVSNNSAGRGGGGLALLAPGALALDASTVSGNAAAFCGGALLDTPRSDSSIHASRFTANAAGDAAGVAAGAAAGAGMRELLAAPAAPTFGQLPAWNATGSGGGLCVIPGASVAITASTFSRNSALHGAGMFVQDCVSRLGSGAAAVKAGVKAGSGRGGALCRVLVGPKTVIEGNIEQSDGSGGAYYTTDVASVAVAASARAGRPRDMVRPHAGGLAGPDAPSGASGDDSVASKPASVLGGFTQQHGRGYSPAAPGAIAQQVLLVDSGTTLPGVQLQLVDQMGQLLPASVLAQLTFRAQATAVTRNAESDTNLIGVTSVVPAAAGARGNASAAAAAAGRGAAANDSTGLVHFNWLELQGAPGAVFNLSFAVLEAPEVQPAVVRVQLKACRPGQAVLRGRGTDLKAGCTNCTNPLFSFDPTYPQCQSCPPPDTYSRCGGDVITPASGYWQSHPRSAQLQACLNPAACSRSSRADAQLLAVSRGMAAAAAAAAAPGSGATGRRLAAAAPPGAWLNASAVSGYQQLQCADGFAGHLCSNCVRDTRVSQTQGHTCKACIVSRGASILLFILVRCFDLSIVLLQVFLVLRERQRRQIAVNSLTVTASSIRAAMQAGAAIVPPRGGHAPLEFKPMADQQGATAAAASGVDTYLMMFIEYMQLLSIFRLTRIGTLWRSAAETVLLALSITPISTYSWMSLDCALPPGLSAQAYAYYATLASTYVPLALVVVTCSIVAAKNLARAHRLGFVRLLTFPALVPELLAAAMKAVAYGYPVVTGSVLGLFSCKQLDRPPQLPGELTAAVGNFWNRDLDTACYAGSHLTYALAVGLPMLLAVIVYPLVQAGLLARQARAKPDGLAEVSYWASYSHVYAEYRPRLYAWGSVRELRQLGLIGAVVALQAHPVQLQMLGGWLASLGLLGLHAAVGPFRARLLNGLQAAMLGAVSLTFYVAVLSSVPGVPAGAAVALQFIAVAVDVAVGLLLLGLLLWRALLSLDHDHDGKVSWADVKHSLAGQGSGAAKLLHSVSSAGRGLVSRTSSRIGARRGSASSQASGALSPAGSSTLSPMPSHTVSPAPSHGVDSHAGWNGVDSLPSAGMSSLPSGGMSHGGMSSLPSHVADSTGVVSGGALDGQGTDRAGGPA